MLERTLAARGSLPAVHGSPADSQGLRTAGGSNASSALAASGLSGTGASAAAGGASTSAAAAAAATIVPRPSPPTSPLPGVPLSPSALGARGRLDSGVGTSGSGAQTPLSGYSSMAAEVGSAGDTPRRGLDSDPQP